MKFESNHDFGNWYGRLNGSSPIRKLPKELVEQVWEAGSNYWKATAKSYQEAAMFEFDIALDKEYELREWTDEFLILHGLEHMVDVYQDFTCRMEDVKDIQDLDEYLENWDE